MPTFKKHTAVEITRKVRLFLSLEAGLTGIGETIRHLGSRLKSDERPPTGKLESPASSPQAGNIATPQQGQPGGQGQKLRRARLRLAEKDREISRLQRQLAGVESNGISPGNLIWLFGTGRTGSSWLGAMMGDIEGCTLWNEPYVGDVFGYAYYLRAQDAMKERNHFILGDPYKEAWLGSIRRFVLEGAAARFPRLSGDGYLAVKEPNGSIGAPLLAEALPESRVILLVRDTRDVVASSLAAQRKGSWGLKWSGGEPLADRDPDQFVRQRSHLCLQSLEKAREAYEAHKGPKIVVRYEDLRHDTIEVMRTIYSGLDVPVDEEELKQVVERHAWENVPDSQKGADKPRRKAKPGGWKEDLTPEQAKTVEEITAPFLDEFYPGEEADKDEQSRLTPGRANAPEGTG